MLAEKGDMTVWRLALELLGHIGTGPWSGWVSLSHCEDEMTASGTWHCAWHTQRAQSWEPLLPATSQEEKATAHTGQTKIQELQLCPKKSPFGVRKTRERTDYGPNLLLTLIYFSVAILWRTYKKGGHSSTINALTLKVLFKTSTPKCPLKVIPKPVPSQPGNLPRHHTVTHASIQQVSAGWIYSVCQPLTTAKLYSFSDLYLCESTIIHV